MALLSCYISAWAIGAFASVYSLISTGGVANGLTFVGFGALAIGTIGLLHVTRESDEEQRREMEERR